MNQEFVVKVGKKRVWSYVTACITHFNSGGNRILIRGRGSSAYKVVEVANTLRRTFLKDLIYEQVQIVEDEFVLENNKRVRVPVLEVTVALPEASSQRRQ
ncbi:MAG: RNA-binding protein [Candidatus Bathyarchaeia archaeon]